MHKFEVSFKAGSTVFEEGTIEDKMYFIQKGKVEISKTMGDMEQVVALLGKGDFFGEMALISESPRSATAVAVKDTVAVVFNRRQFLSIIKSRGELALKILDGLILRLKESNDKIHQLIQKNQNALVFDTLSKWLQLQDGDPDIQQASEWVSQQLGMRKREAEAVIRKLTLEDLVCITDNRVSINGSNTAEKIKNLLSREQVI